MGGRTLTVNEAKPQEPRSGGGGDGYGGGGNRGGWWKARSLVETELSGPDLPITRRGPEFPPKTGS